MTSKTEKAAKPQATADLAALYRPLGIKAVQAAHLMLKSKPLLKKSA